MNSDVNRQKVTQPQSVPCFFLPTTFYPVTEFYMKVRTISDHNKMVSSIEWTLGVTRKFPCLSIQKSWLIKFFLRCHMYAHFTAGGGGMPGRIARMGLLAGCKIVDCPINLWNPKIHYTLKGPFPHIWLAYKSYGWKGLDYNMRRRAF